jgi:DNA polymerase family B
VWGVTPGDPETEEGKREEERGRKITTVAGIIETPRYLPPKIEPLTLSQQQLLLQKPKITEGERLFFGEAWVAWDLEWYPNTTKIYAAAVVNYKGEFRVMHISDYDEDEGQLLDAIVAEVLKYPISFGYYSTGLEINGKGKFSDLDTLAKALARNKRRNPIDLYMPDRGYGRERPRFKEYTNHIHFDLYNIFDNEVIKGFLEEEKYKIRTAATLDYVSKVITGQGKLKNLNGLKVISENVDVQKNYVLWDTVNVHNIIKTKVMQHTFTILKEFADAMNATLEWVCYTTTTNWWTKIFDDRRCTRPTGYHKAEYPGGLVLECKSGYYKDVALVDVSSLYPTMAIIHNLGYDTINCPCCKDDLDARVPLHALIDPEGNPIKAQYWVCRKKVSVYRDQLLRFKEAKDNADAAGQKLKKKAYKLLLNSSYGTWATAGHAYLCPHVSILITGWGRHALRTMHDVALEMGLEPIAGDTDSLFLANLKTKKQFNEFVKRCNDILKVNDPITGEIWNVKIDNESGGDDTKLPVTFKHFWNMHKKHYYYINTKGEFDSTKLEVEKDDRVPYSATVLWKQWGKDLEDGKDPIPNLQRLTSNDELQCILEREPELLMNSQKLEKDPGYIDQETGELKECEYSNPFGTPQVVLARELGLRKHDIVYFFKSGENKGKIDDNLGKPIGTYTANPKYADINKIKDDIANSFMDVLKVYLGYPIEPDDEEIEKKIKREVFGLGD